MTQLFTKFTSFFSYLRNPFPVSSPLCCFFNHVSFAGGIVRVFGSLVNGAKQEWYPFPQQNEFKIIKFVCHFISTVCMCVFLLSVVVSLFAFLPSPSSRVSCPQVWERMLYFCMRVTRVTQATVSIVFRDSVCRSCLTNTGFSSMQWWDH